MKKHVKTSTSSLDCTDNGRFCVANATDEWLILNYASTGESAAFTELVRRYQVELTNYLHRFLGDLELARDVVQTTLLQLHLKSHMFTKGRRFRPWLYAIAVNQAIDASRSQRRHRATSIDHPTQTALTWTETLAERLVDSEVGPVLQNERREARAGVRQAVDRLPIQLRRLVRLIFFDGMKYREAADLLSIPEGTVKSRMHLAFSKLQEGLAQTASCSA